MIRSSRLASALLLATVAGGAGLRPARADEAAPPAPPAKAPPVEEATARAESKVMRAVLKAIGRILVRYLDEKQDAEKASAYEDVFRALSDVLNGLDREDERGLVAAGMKAMLDLMPKMRAPKRAEVMREVLMTLSTAVAESMRDEVADARPAVRPEAGAAARPEAASPRALGEMLMGGVADAVLEEVTAHTLGGARLDAPVPGVEGFRVKAVAPGSKAAEFGLRAGDAIIRFGDAKATWRSLLAAGVALHRRLEFPPMTVMRDGKAVELKVAIVAPK